MPCRVKRSAAERARRPTGGNDLAASTCERAGRGRLDHYPQDRLEGPGLLGLEHGLTLLIDHQLLLPVVALHDDDPTFGIPPEAHRADPELVLDGGGQRVNVLEGLGNDIRSLTRGKVIEQVVDPVGERAQLLLLQRHRGQPRPGAGLQEEGSLAGRPDSARDEPIWWVELKDRHTDNFSRRHQRRHQLARRPQAAPELTDRSRHR